MRPVTGAGEAGTAGVRAAGGDLARRLSVAAVGIPLAVALAYAGGAAFAAALGVLAAGAVWEYARMLRNRGVRVPVALAGGAAGLFPLAVLYLGLGGAWIAAALLVLAAGGYATLRRPPEEGPTLAAAATVFGVLWLGGLLSFGVLLRETLLPGRVEGTLVFFLPVAVTWLADTAAYLTGRTLGRRQLAPRISPNKTVEGAVGALVAGPIGAAAYGWLFLPPLAARLGWGGLALLGIVVAAAAVLGDLVESALKRECRVKDASNLLPGHGGLLDRLDSLLWSIPVAYLFLSGAS